MNTLRRTAAALVFICAGYAAFASAVSVQVLQRDEGVTDVRETSKLIEDEILDVLFDGGQIVSNSPISISSGEKEDSEICAKCFRDAMDGYVDYFVTILIEFDETGSTNPAAPMVGCIRTVSWKIARVPDAIVISKGSMEPEKIDSAHDNESSVKNYARQIAEKIRSSLK